MYKRNLLPDGSWYPCIPDLCHCDCGMIVYNGTKFVNGHNSRVNNPNFGNHLSEENKEKIRVANTGRDPWNKNLVDCYSEKTLQMMSEAKKNKLLSAIHKQRIGISGIGKHCGDLNPMKRPEVVAKISGDLSSSKRLEVRTKMKQSRKIYFEEHPEAKEIIRQAQFDRYFHLFSVLDRFIKDKYCILWTKELREEVRIRDSYVCQKCGLKQSDLTEFHKHHSVHHIHYDKQNCYPDLICLCSSCNSIVNFNRSYYESLFMNKLNERNLLFWTRNRN